MGKPQTFSITLSCDHSFAPGQEWDAGVGFSPTKKGFSAWAWGSNGDGTDYYQRIAYVRGRQLTWRNACRVLLSARKGRLYGDFRGDVRAEGVGGYETEVLAACWMQEDGVSEELKVFIVELEDGDVGWLVDKMGGELFSDLAIEKLERFIELEERSPRVCWEEHAPQDFEALLDQLESHANDQETRRKSELLERIAPYTERINNIIEEVEAGRGKATNMWGGIARGRRKTMMRHSLIEFVENNKRLPDTGEVKQITSKLKQPS